METGPKTTAVLSPSPDWERMCSPGERRTDRIESKMESWGKLENEVNKMGRG